MFEWIFPKRGETRIYRAVDGWRWRAVSNNQRIVADSGEAFDSQDNAERSAEDFGPRRFKIVVMGG